MGIVQSTRDDMRDSIKNSITDDSGGSHAVYTTSIMCAYKYKSLVTGMGILTWQIIAIYKTTGLDAIAQGEILQSNVVIESTKIP